MDFLDQSAFHGCRSHLRPTFRDARLQTLSLHRSTGSGRLVWLISLHCVHNVFPHSGHLGRCIISLDLVENFGTPLSRHWGFNHLRSLRRSHCFRALDSACNLQKPNFSCKLHRNGPPRHDPMVAALLLATLLRSRQRLLSGHIRGCFIPTDFHCSPINYGGGNLDHDYWPISVGYMVWLGLDMPWNWSPLPPGCRYLDCRMGLPERNRRTGNGHAISKYGLCHSGVSKE